MHKRIILVLLILLASSFATSAFADILSSSPVKVHLSAYGSNEKSQRGLFTTDFIIPLYYSDDKDTLFFFNPKYTYTTPNADEINQGIGLRHIFNDSFILGLNTFFDRRMAHSGKWYSQAGLGLEYLSHPLDIRLNWYKPITQAKVVDTTYSFGPTSLIQYDNKEEPLQGLDFEIGTPVFDQYTKTRLYLGGFFYQSRLSRDVNGFRVRTETSLAKWFNLDTTFESKGDGETKFYGGVRVTLPFELTKFFKPKKQPLDTPAAPSSYLQECIFDRVVRDIDIQSKSSTQQSKKHDLTYVDNSNTTGIEDGTYEHPYTKIQDGVDNATGDKWVYVRQGGGDYNEGNIDLVENITLWGSGYNGGFKGIPVTGYPIISDSTINIENKNNCNVMGLRITGENPGMTRINIVGDANNIIISNNLFADNPRISSVILIQSGGAYSTTSNITIEDNVFNVFAENVVYHIHLLQDADVGGVFDNITIQRNTLTGAGIYVENLNGTVRNISIAYNDIGDAPGYGIYFINSFEYSDPPRKAKLAENIYILNNTIHNITENTNNGFGVMIHAYAGEFKDFVISDNKFHSNDIGGMWLKAAYGGALADVAVSGNTVYNNKEYGILFDISDKDSVLTASVSGNVIRDNGTGVFITRDDSDNNLVVDLGGGSMDSRGQNSFYDNLGNDVYRRTEYVPAVDAKYNWWGQASGPADGKISEAVNYEPWLTSNPN